MFSKLQDKYKGKFAVFASYKKESLKQTVVFEPVIIDDLQIRDNKLVFVTKDEYGSIIQFQFPMSGTLEKTIDFLSHNIFHNISVLGQGENPDYDLQNFSTKDFLNPGEKIKRFSHGEIIEITDSNIDNFELIDDFCLYNSSDRSNLSVYMVYKNKNKYYIQELSEEKTRFLYAKLSKK